LQKTITKVALAYIFDAQGRVLIAKRCQSKHMGGFWEFPGGKLELGESPVQAIEREILEELAIRVTGDAVLPSFVLPQSDDLLFFPIVCKWLGGDIVLLEHDEYRFVVPENLAGDFLAQVSLADISLADVPLAKNSLAPADVVAAQLLINFLRAKPEK
jgi:mutator protein MutT